MNEEKRIEIESKIVGHFLKYPKPLCVQEISEAIHENERDVLSCINHSEKVKIAHARVLSLSVSNSTFYYLKESRARRAKTPALFIL